jgi:hypothetical protein
MQVRHDRRVDVAAAGAHDQALERGEPHRGVDAATTGDRGGARAVAEVQHDHVGLLRPAAEQPGGGA